MAEHAKKQDPSETGFFDSNFAFSESLHFSASELTWLSSYLLRKPNVHKFNKKVLAGSVNIGSVNDRQPKFPHWLSKRNNWFRDDGTPAE